MKTVELARIVLDYPDAEVLIENDKGDDVEIVDVCVSSRKVRSKEVITVVIIGE